MKKWIALTVTAALLATSGTFAFAQQASESTANKQAVPVELQPKVEQMRTLDTQARDILQQMKALRGDAKEGRKDAKDARQGLKQKNQQVSDSTLQQIKSLRKQLKEAKKARDSQKAANIKTALDKLLQEKGLKTEKNKLDKKELKKKKEQWMAEHKDLQPLFEQVSPIRQELKTIGQSLRAKRTEYKQALEAKDTAKAGAALDSMIQLKTRRNECLKKLLEIRTEMKKVMDKQKAAA